MILVGGGSCCQTIYKLKTHRQLFRPIYVNRLLILVFVAFCSVHCQEHV